MSAPKQAMRFTPRWWARIREALEVALRSESCPLSGYARLLVREVVRATSVGEGLPAQERLALRLGMGERALASARAELRELDLVWGGEHRGSAPATWGIIPERFEAWLFDGEALYQDASPAAAVAAGTPFGPADRAGFVPANAGASTADQRDNGAFVAANAGTSTADRGEYSRARGSFSSSAHDLSADSSADAVRDGIAQRMFSTLRQHGIRVSFAAKRRIRSSWVDAYTEDELEAAAEAADTHGVHSLAYVEAALERNRASARVSTMGDWR